MKARFGYDELQNKLTSQLFCFPVTDFGSDGRVDTRAFAERIDWLGSFKPGAQFPCGGAGEYFSLTDAEYADVTAEAVRRRNPDVPVIGAAGAGTHKAVEHAQLAEELGVDGLLLLPPYLTETSQPGLEAHIRHVCQSTRLPVIVYNRANCRLATETVVRVAEQCPNFIALKDGLGDIEAVLSMRAALQERILLINGMPTAEVYGPAYAAMGVSSYSSAVFNFLPQFALDFHRAVIQGDAAFTERQLADFFLPYVSVRARGPGYAVSIAKAGVDIIGRGAGHVRPPISDLRQQEYSDLASLIRRVLPVSGDVDFSRKGRT